MAKTEEIELDPLRLLTLDRLRRAARAQQRDASDTYQEAREQREDARQRATSARRKAQDVRGPGHDEAMTLADAVDTEVEKFTRRMADHQAEADAHSTEASRANTLLTRCLRHAAEAGLTIPEELTDDAERAVRRGAL